MIKILATTFVTVSLLGGAAAFATDDDRGLVPDDGMTAAERAEIYGDGPNIQADHRDVIIAHASRRIMYFGMYRASQMTNPGWDLFGRSIDWVNDFGNRSTTKIWLATYNGTLDEDFIQERDSIAVYNHLIGPMGFNAANINVAHQSSIETANFSGYDMVIYSWVYPRDATNVLNQNMPFLTFSSGETDELGIGTGVETMHEFRDTTYVIENEHYVTSPYPLGPLILAEGMWIDATEATGAGVALTTADEPCLYLDASVLQAGQFASFDVTGAPNGEFIAVVYGLTPGQTVVNNVLNFCATFDIRNVSRGELVTWGLVSGGAFNGARKIPAGTSGITVLLQAAQRDTCPTECVSNLVTRTIQ